MLSSAQARQVLRSPLSFETMSIHCLWLSCPRDGVRALHVYQDMISGGQVDQHRSSSYIIVDGPLSLQLKTHPSMHMSHGYWSIPPPMPLWRRQRTSISTRFTYSPH